MTNQSVPAPIADFARAEMARLEVPGLAMGVLHDGVTYTGGFGMTNVNHPLPVDADTLFQVGSTSKTFTATALMRLVERGEADLEAPVRRYLPDFQLESESDAAALTLKQLVTHHGGFVGDIFATQAAATTRSRRSWRRWRALHSSFQPVTRFRTAMPVSTC